MTARRTTRRRWAGLTLRARLVAGFAVAMAIVLAGSGVFVYWRVAFALDRRLDSDLADNAATVQALLGPDGALTGAGALGTTPALSDFQVLRSDNSVASSGPGLGDASLLTTDQHRTAQESVVTVEVGSMVPISARPLRLRAEPAGTFVLVVGVRRDARDEALRELIVQLAVAGLGTLAVSTLVGERLAKAALRPVERYRTQATEIAGGTVGVRLDVPWDRDDELTRLGDTLNTMLDSLERAAARERRFLQDASHELRTPLTLLRTRTQLALSQPRTVAEHEQTLAELDTDIRELTTLAGRLLQLGVAAEAASSTASTAVGRGNPGEVLLALHRQTTNSLVDGLPPNWTLHLPPTSPSVGMSDAQLRQIVTNLLANAAAHGQPPVHAALNVLGQGVACVAVMTVADAGTQLAGPFLPIAADRFSRTDEARSRPGAGLGLSLVLALVEQHGGELRLCADGQHHRYQQRFDVPCTHSSSGTVASVLLAGS